MSKISLRGLAIAAVATTPAVSLAQSATDLFQGSTVGNTTGLGSGNGTSPDGMFGGTNVGPEAGNSIFNDATDTAVIGTDLVHYAQFTPLGGPVTLTKIVAYFTTDGDIVSRRADDFTLIADTDGVEGFSAADTFAVSGPITYVGRTAVVTLALNVTASAFRLEIDPSETGVFTGVRVNEIDAFAVAPPVYFTGSQNNNLSSSPGGLTNFATTPAGTTNAGVVPGRATDVSFGATGNVNAANFDTVLDTDLTVNSLTFGNGANTTTPVTIAGPNTLTINADPINYAAGTGIVMAAGSAANGISANVMIGNTQTWRNDAAAPLTVSGTVGLAGNDLTLAGTGGKTLSGAIGGTGRIFVAGGNVRLSGANTYAGATTIIAGTLTATPAAYANLLTNAGGLVIDGGEVAFNYVGASPVAQVKAVLAAGYADGFLIGQIRTTALPPGLTIGYGDDAAGVVKLRLTLPGDADLDGDVDFNDFLALQTNFGTADTRFDQGNFNYDAATDFNDFLALQTNFGQSVGGGAVAVTGEQIAAVTAFGVANAVPEPAMVAMLGVAAGTLGRRRL